MVLLVIFFLLANCKPNTVPLYVGTYTNGDSEGIYKFDFNLETGILSNKTLAAIIDNPSFIDFSPNKAYLYAVGEGKTMSVTAFKLKDDGTLEVLNSRSSNGKYPCHVSINEEGDKAVVSNYGGGNFSIYNINADGSLGEASQIFDHNLENKKAHTHSAQFFKDKLYVADLGRNAVYLYTFKDGSYVLESPSIIKMEGNPGPRHFEITKNGDFIYIINEYGSSITSVKHTASGYTQIDDDSTLDENYKGPNSCADIHLSKDERFLYGSNRGENSIAVFKRNLGNGEITKIQNIPVHGNWPRNFTLDPTGKFLLVANKKSNNISVFKIDSETGKLNFLHDIKTPAPVCLLF